MRPLRVILFSLAAATLAFAQPAGTPKLGANAPTMGYKEVPEWPAPVLNAAGTPGGPWNFIQVSGVAINSNGNILVLHRGAHPIMEFEPSGKYVRSWGDGMFSEGKVSAIAPADRVPGRALYSAIYGPAGCDSCGAHSIRVDPGHNIWVVDAPGHVIYKMSQQGKILMQLGHKGVSGASHDTFNLPTDVAFAPNGDFYISDGYAGNRVVKFSPDGRYLLEWGTRGTGPGQFELPHNLAIDAEGKVYVSDRETHRIEVFDPNGRFITEWPVFEAVSGLVMTKDQHLWAGGVLLNLKGEVLGRLPNATAAGCHAVAVTDSGDVYLAQLSGKVQKFVRR